MFRTVLSVAALAVATHAQQPTGASTSVIWNPAFADDFASFDRNAWDTSLGDWKGTAPGAFDAKNVGATANQLTLKTTYDTGFTPAGGDPDCDCGFENIATSMVVTKKRFQYGFFEAKAMAHSSSLVNSFWLQGATSEINIMEIVTDNKKLRSNHHCWDAVAEQGDGTVDSQQAAYTAGSSFTWSSMHTYGVDWQPTEIKFYVDGKLSRTLKKSQYSASRQECMDEPMNIILSTETSPSEGIPSPFSSAKNFVVDYVRYWDTKQAVTTAKPTTPKPTTPNPTTPNPTTTKPTTVKPTTPKPTTTKPTTPKPTTEKPTTAKPTTEKPTTAKPTTEKPTTVNPETTAAASAYRLLTAGKCADVSMAPITSVDDCETAAKFLKLEDVSAQSTGSEERPEGCYIVKSSSSLWFARNLEDNAGNGASTRRLQLCKRLATGPTDKPTDKPATARKNCEDLGWSVAKRAKDGFKDVCVGRYGLFDKCWKQKKDYNERTFTQAKEQCSAIGARLCTGQEMQKDVGRAIGCNFAQKRYHFVSDTGVCPAGQVQTIWGMYSKSKYPPKCVPETEKMHVRCCSDVDLSKVGEAASSSSAVASPSAHFPGEVEVQDRDAGADDEEDKVAGGAATSVATGFGVAIVIVAAIVAVAFATRRPHTTDTTEQDAEIGAGSEGSSFDETADAVSQASAGSTFEENSFVLTGTGDSLRMQSIHRGNPAYLQSVYHEAETAGDDAVFLHGAVTEDKLAGDNV